MNGLRLGDNAGKTHAGQVLQEGDAVLEEELPVVERLALDSDLVDALEDEADGGGDLAAVVLVDDVAPEADELAPDDRLGRDPVAVDDAFNVLELGLKVLAWLGDVFGCRTPQAVELHSRLHPRCDLGLAQMLLQS